MGRGWVLSGTPAQFTTQLGAADVVLGSDVLERIGEIVPTGTTIDPADRSWQKLALDRQARRRTV